MLSAVRRHQNSIACALALAVLLSTPAGAATDEELFRDLRFDLTSPGPRARALGGAFVALGGDATVAGANPAALYEITRAAGFVELRASDRDPYRSSSESGSLDVDPVSGARELPFLGLTSTSDADDELDPAFAGVVLPFSLGAANRPAAVFVSRRLLLSEHRTLGLPGAPTEARAAFPTYPNTVDGSDVVAYSIGRTVSGSRAIEVDSYSVGAAFGFHPDFSAGLTATTMTLDLSASSASVTDDPQGLVLDPGHPRLPSQPTSDLFSSFVDGTDSDLTYSVGLHWHPDSVVAGGRSPWRLGAVLHKGASFDIDQTVFLNGIVDSTFVNQITLPDRLAVGVGYRHGERWRFALELERVQYSDMLDGFAAGINPLTSERFAAGSFTTDPDAELRYTVDDATVPRFGVEYSPPDGAAAGVVLRAGYYREADSRIRMESFNSTDGTVNDVYLAAFGGGDDVNHLTAGLGYGLGRFDFQLAGDFSDDGSVVGAGLTIEWGNR